MPMSKVEEKGASEIWVKEISFLPSYLGVYLFIVVILKEGFLLLLPSLLLTSWICSGLRKKMLSACIENKVTASIVFFATQVIFWTVFLLILMLAKKQV